MSNRNNTYVEIQHLKLHVQFHVIKNLSHNIILGLDLFTDHQTILNSKNNTILFQGNFIISNINIHTHSHQKCNYIYITKLISIQSTLLQRDRYILRKRRVVRNRVVRDMNSIEK